MHRGYVKLWRCIEDTGLMGQPAAFYLYTFLLLKATHKAKSFVVGGSVFDLLPGQVVIGRNKLSEETGLSVQQVRTALELLKKLSIISCKSTNKCTIISIENWDAYQQQAPEDNQQNSQYVNQRPTSAQPAPNQRPTTIQEFKNLRIEENINTPFPPQGELVQVKPARVKAEYPADFEEFWKLYPRKNGKDAALRAWKTKKREGRLPAISVLSDAIAAAKRSDQWQRDGGQYIPHPATWLNQGRWMDEQAQEEPAFRIPDWARSGKI